MSRRTSPWFAAGLLAALAVSPAFAQSPNPWRGKDRNPWRNAAPDVAAETTLYPPCHGTITLGVVVTGEQVRGTADVEFERVGPSAAPMPRCCEAECRAATCRTALTAAVHEMPPAAAGKLTGTWYREAPGSVTAITLAGTDLKMTTTANTGHGLVTITLTADYAVTKDGTVHGVFTGADVDVNSVADPELSLELAGQSLRLQELVDLPFAFRCRPCDGGLMVSHLRMPVAAGEPMDTVGALSGKYKAATGALPAPKGLGLVLNQYSSDPNVMIPPTAYGAPLPVPPAYCPGPPALGPVPCPAGPPLAVAPVPCPAGPPPEVRDTMTRVFNEMLGAPPPYGPPACVPSYPPPAVNPAVNPAAYVAPQLPPLPPCPPPSEQPAKLVPLPAPGQIPAGTWVREVGPMTYRIDAKDGYFTVTLTLTGEVDGQTMSMDHVLVVESSATRTNGQTVGLITGFDVSGSGMDLEDSTELLDKLPKIQKALADKPVALSFRVYDDTLVIRNVRLPAADEDGDEMLKVFATMGGRYRLSNGLPPKPKAVKAKVVQSGMTLPSPRYLEHNPQSFSPDPNFPLPREIATQSDPNVPVRIGIDFNVNPPRVISEPLAATVPPMPPPAPLPGAKKPNPFRNGGATGDVPLIPRAAK